MQNYSKDLLCTMLEAKIDFDYYVVALIYNKAKPWEFKLFT